MQTLASEKLHPDRRRRKKGHRQKSRPRRGNLRRLLRLFLFLFTLAGLSALFVGGYRTLLTSPLLEVATIQVTGCNHLRPETIIRQSGIRAGVNILSLDLGAVSRRVAAHPWVAETVVVREIPDRVRIQIEERQPVALVRGNSFYLMDLQGHCFARESPGKYPRLPIISGLAPETVATGSTIPPEPLELLVALHEQCKAQLPWRLISEIHWDQSTGLTLFTVGGALGIKLGRGDYGSKLTRLGRVLSYLESKGVATGIRSIDLAYRDRVFVRGNFENMHQDRQPRGV